jgi:hypothetical protein
MAPIVHPGRQLKRELTVREFSANRLALVLGVPFRPHHRYPDAAVAVAEKGLESVPVEERDHHRVMSCDSS